MCGIIGVLKQNKKINIDVFNNMRDELFHRGPDDFGTVPFEDEKCAFGHRRLSIIDLSNNAKQPMYDDDKKILLTFNGEIYNYKKLKRELLELGYKFKSNSDTEVLIYGYKEWGIESLLNRLKGMFAFGIWDDSKKQLFIARDRFGIKPLYYYKNNDQFCFASELKVFVKDLSIKKKINMDAIADYFIYSYVPSPNCIWKNFYKLEPASYGVYNFNKNTFSIKEYWKLKIDNKIVSSDEAYYKTKELIKESVSEHFVSDVPIGLFLSGGYDSSTLLIYADELKYKPNTFSLGFKNSHRSEHEIAEIIAKKYKTNHTESILDSTNNDYIEDLKKLTYFYDEPFAVSSMLPYYYVSKLASKSNKVAIAGDGGDEVFAGYKWHKSIKIFFENKSFLGKAKTFYRGRRNELIEIYNKRMTSSYTKGIDFTFINSDLQKKINEREFWFFKKHYINNPDILKTTQYMDFKTFIPEVNLTRADRSSMANSLEVRVPFLDHKIYEYIFGLDSSVYYRKNNKKYLLERNLKNKLSKEVLNMPKYGFSFQFLDKIFDKSFEDLILKGNLMKHNIIRKNIDFKEIDYVTKFHLLMLELWFVNYG